MSLYEELSTLKSLYLSLREDTYFIPDNCGSTDNDSIITRMPEIDNELLQDILNNLETINTEFDSKLLDEIIEYFSSDSSITEYVNFDEDSFQMDYINDKPDAYEENLSAYQNEAAQLSGESKSQLWDEAYDDFQYLMETLFPKLFDVSECN